jgi:predicted nucleic acid-binding protein
MFILDTNILSAMMAPEPVPQVEAFVSAQPMELLFTTSICEAEILAGIAIMPEGRRRLGLASAAQAMFSEDFEGRVLPFDEEAAIAYAHLFAVCRKTGRPVAAFDLMISAVASCHKAKIVTRNAADFEGCGVTVINPWD